MKSTIIIFATILILSNSLWGSSQSWGGASRPDQSKATVIDSASYRFSYKLRYIVDTTRIDDISEQILVLQVGNKSSKCFPEEYEKPVHLVGEAIVGFESRGLGATEVTKTMSNNEMKVRTQTTYAGIFEYTEPLPKQVWLICAEKKNIQGYPCQKATTTYLGRTYIAWFTPEIPIPSGPWKFGGLPGLILNISDNRRHYAFECIGIKKLDKREPIVEYNLKCKKTSRDKLNKLIEMEYNQTDAVIAANGINIVATVIMEADGSKTVVTDRNSPKLKALRNRATPYNPIELE